MNVDLVHALDAWPYGFYGFAAVFGTKKKLFINGIGTYSVAPLYSLRAGCFCGWHMAARRKYSASAPIRKCSLRKRESPRESSRWSYLGQAISRNHRKNTYWK